MKFFTKKFTILAIVLIGAFASYNFVADNDKFFEISKNIEIFANLYKELNTYYVDEVDPASLMRIGLDAMLESLDPYTNYISESEIEGYRYMTEGKYNGIGAMIKSSGDNIMIAEPYEGSPADKAGLKAGDVIIAVDGKITAGKKREDVNEILKGYPGTEVVLTIQRPGESKDKKITLTRDEVKVPNVPYSGMVSDEVGYVALTTFTRNAGKNVADALSNLKKENPSMKGIIFDLRGNGGGLLTEAVNVSNVFVPKGEMIVSTLGKVKEWDRSFKTLNAPVDEEIQLAVLIDKNSASASEIVSGVLQDLDRGVLIGQRSYGKGLVQNTRDVGYNSKVKLTTAKYYIPSGRCIQGVSYKDGEPVDIPDEKRTAFKTRNGRKVLDGGGVKPDINLDKNWDDSVIKGLLDKDMIFNFATQYVLKNPTAASIDDVNFTDYDSFLSFLNREKFVYQTKSEKELKQLKKTAKAEKIEDKLNIDFKSIEDKIAAVKKAELTSYKEDILNLIEKEIAGRYFYQKGKLQMGLKNDKEIKEAVKLFDNPTKYKQLLKN